MLGLLLIYFIGRYFYDLASEYKKSKWGFAILGIVTYYAGTFIVGIALGIIDLLAGTNNVETLPRIALGLIALPFGLLSCWGLYKILQNQWRKKIITTDMNTLDGDIVEGI